MPGEQIHKHSHTQQSLQWEVPPQSKQPWTDGDRDRVTCPTVSTNSRQVGLAPRVLKFRLPNSAPGSTVHTFQPMSDINVSVKIGVLATFEYEYPTGAILVT